MRVMYAITAHGWGHFTRSAALLTALHDIDASLELHIATALPHAQLRHHLPFDFEHRAVDYEPGVAQRNCLDIDREATVAAYEAYLASRPGRLTAERAYLQDASIDGVISDIAALPIRAAGSLGLPAVGVANFTWDWILEPLLRGTRVAQVPQVLAGDYAQGRELLLLPFGQSTSRFPQTTPVPVLARPSRTSRMATLCTLGLERSGLGSSSPPVILVCLGGWDGDGLPPIEVEPTLEARFVASEGLPIRFPSQPVTFGAELPGDLVFPDLVAAADLVVTKPGYGIASECVTQGCPILMVERHDFREAPALFEAVGKAHPLRVLRREPFAAGRWADAATALLAEPRPAPVTLDNHSLARRVLAALHT